MKRDSIFRIDLVEVFCNIRYLHSYNKLMSQSVRKMGFYWMKQVASCKKLPSVVSRSWQS